MKSVSKRKREWCGAAALVFGGACQFRRLQCAHRGPLVGRRPIMSCGLVGTRNIEL